MGDSSNVAEDYARELPTRLFNCSSSDSRQEPRPLKLHLMMTGFWPAVSDGERVVPTSISPLNGGQNPRWETTRRHQTRLDAISRSFMRSVVNHALICNGALRIIA